jgi:hypothetical protein
VAYKSDYRQLGYLGERDIIEAGKPLDVYNAKALSEAATVENSHSLATAGCFGYANETVN